MGNRSAVLNGRCLCFFWNVLWRSCNLEIIWNLLFEHWNLTICLNFVIWVLVFHILDIAGWILFSIFKVWPQILILFYTCKIRITKFGILEIGFCVLFENLLFAIWNLFLSVVKNYWCLRGKIISQKLKGMIIE